MPALEGLAAAAEEEQRPTALSASHGVTVTPQIMRPPNAISNVVELQRRIAPRRGEEAGAPLSSGATTKRRTRKVRLRASKRSAAELPSASLSERSEQCRRERADTPYRLRATTK